MWSVAGNWSGAMTPVSGATTDLVFGGAAAFIATNDLPPPFQLNSLTFSASAPVELAGGALEFLTDGAVAPTLVQMGAGTVRIGNDLLLTNLVTLSGAGSGAVTLRGVLSGAGGLDLAAGTWQLTNAASSFTGGTTIRAGAVLELIGDGADPQNAALTVSAAGPLGDTTNNTTNLLRLNGGTLKLSTRGSGAIILDGTRTITFAANGGTLDLTNSNLTLPEAHGGHIIGGELNLRLNNTAGPAVIKFNGGQLGFSDFSNPMSGVWTTDANTLRLGVVNPVGTTNAVRVELSNAAMLRSGDGGGASITYALTVRGPLGGDPTAGPLGDVDPGRTRATGRFVIDNADETTYTTGLGFQGAVQVGVVGRSRALNGAITVAGLDSGAAGYVDFTGRATQSQFTDTVNMPGVAGNAQNPLWLLRDGNGSLTIERGGVAVFDVRQRTDGTGQHGNGVALDGLARILGGGELRLWQSASNYTPGVTAINSNAGDVVIYGDIRGEGTTANEAVLNIALPAPVPEATLESTVPFAFTATPTLDGQRPYGGARFDDSRGNADFIVNGSGFGGLKIAAQRRPNALLMGGIADPVSGVDKLAPVLTSTRLARLTGTGGYLTVATLGETWPFPAAGEWSAAVPVGLKITDHYAGGPDVSFAALSAFAHPLVIESSATLALGAGPFAYGPGLLQGAGTITGPLTVTGGAIIAPGPGIAALTTGDATFLDGVTLQLELTAAQSDQLLVLGALTFGGAVTLDLSFNFDPIDFTDSFVLIANDGVDPMQGPGLLHSGNVPLPQDAIFAVTSGGVTQQFRLSYTGGDGNDVVAAATPEPGAAFAFLVAAGVLFGRRKTFRR
jgi:fibronectin-binding autotransporter adhesin